MKTNKIYLYSLASLTLMTGQMAYAKELASAPTLEGGITASIGTFYVQPSSTLNGFAYSENGDEVNVLEPSADYDFGIQASLGYVFDNTANGIELSYREIDTHDTQTQNGEFDLLPPTGGTTYNEAHNELKYNLNTFDLMISQFLDIGTHMQMRFLGGLSYLNLKQENNVLMSHYQSVEDHFNNKSDYNGWGPRVGIDTRYDFGNGIGIIGGASFAYYLGEMDLNAEKYGLGGDHPILAEDNLDNHAIINLRSNLAVDYVYFFDNEYLSTIGLELGYEIDYYNDGAGEIAQADDGSYEVTSPTTTAVSFAGPYLLLKGVF